MTSTASAAAARGSARSKALYTISRGPVAAVRRRREGLHHPGGAEAPAGARARCRPPGRPRIDCFTIPRRESSSTKPRDRPSSRRSNGSTRLTSAHRSATTPPTGSAISISSWAGSIAPPTAGSTSCASAPIPISPLLSLSVKAALRSTRLHRQSELEQIRTDLRERYAGEKVTLGGQTARRAGAPRATAQRPGRRRSGGGCTVGRDRPRRAWPSPTRSNRSGRCGSAIRSKRG